MKKLIFGIATGIILLTISLYPQSKLLLLMGDDGYKNAELKTYLASLTTPISSSYAKTLDTFISMVKDSLAIANLSDAFDVMYDLGGETSEQSLKNLVKRSHDATAVNSPTFTQWEGFAGNGTSSYLNTNYNPSTQGVNYVLTSASSGIYSRTNLAQASGWGAFGSTTDKRMSSVIYNTINNLHRVNDNTTTAKSNSSSLGLLIANRVGNTKNFYHNSAVSGVEVVAPTGVPDVNIFFITYNNNGTAGSGFYSTHQHSFAFIGRGLSATEARKLTNCVEWLMDSKGKGVI